MALTEETIEDKIEVIGDYKIVHVRTATVIKKDGVELTRSFHRHVVQPTDDTSGQSDEVKAICNVVHTNEIKEAFKKHMESQTGV
tara:strand:- start:9031 stop:9285 length:255 start_codon:yes stop_codon:yes gene_type:complete